MRKLLLHVGFPKCGSTAIQKLLNLNALTLGKAGVFVPGSLGSPNHSRSLLIGCGLNRDDLFVRMHGFPRYLGSDGRKGLVDRVVRALRQEVRLGPSSGLWVISSEYLSCCLRFFEIQALGEVLSGIFDDIDVLAYVRSPVEVALSMWSTNVRQGLCEFVLPSPSRFDYLCNYERILANWSSVFGEESLTVQRYERVGLISSFLGSMGLSSGQIAGLEMPGFQNQKLSHFALLSIAYLNRMCRERRVPIRGKRSRVAEEIACLFSAMSPYELSLSERHKYQEFFGASDDWLRSRYFPGSLDLWPSFGGESDNDLCSPHSLRESELPRVIARHMFDRMTSS